MSLCLSSGLVRDRYTLGRHKLDLRHFQNSDNAGHISGIAKVENVQFKTAFGDTDFTNQDMDTGMSIDFASIWSAMRRSIPGISIRLPTGSGTTDNFFSATVLSPEITNPTSIAVGEGLLIHAGLEHVLYKICVIAEYASGIQRILQLVKLVAQRHALAHHVAPEGGRPRDGSMKKPRCSGEGDACNCPVRRPTWSVA